MHPLLVRQLEESIGSVDALPPKWRGFIAAVDEAYRRADVADDLSGRVSNEHRVEPENPDTAGESNSVRLRQAEEALRHSEERTLSVLESIEDPYFECDLKGYLTYVNRAFCTYLQFERNEVVGRHFRHFTIPQGVRDIFRAFNESYTSGQPNRKLRYNYRQKDGTIRYSETSVSVRRDVSGRPIGFRGVGRDMTDRIRMEEALRVAKDAAEGELAIGRQIQASFLPDSLPQPEGWEIAGCFQPARQVAGDFYDSFPLNGGRLVGLVVADVCDKGVGAALYMALFRSLVRAYADQNFSPLRLAAYRALADSTDEAEAHLRRTVLSTITSTNNYIARTHERANMFATLFFGVINPVTGVLTYVNGGHEPPILCRDGEVQERLVPTGPAVGMLADLQFDVRQTVIRPGNALVVYTDGVTEARNSEGLFFGEPQLLTLIEKRPASASGLVERIRTRLDMHIADGRQYDDITLLAVYRSTGSADNHSEAQGEAPAGPVGEEQMEVEATLDNLAPLREFVEKKCLEAGADEDAVFALTLAVDEMCTNIITHGYADMGPGHIQIKMHCAGDCLRVMISDRGRRFDPNQAAPPDLDADWQERQIGGLGVHLVHTLVDDVDYETDPKTGNHMTLTKHIHRGDRA